MWMIPCDKNCVNQQDGYCCLEGIISVFPTQEDAKKGCLYFTVKGSPQAEAPSYLSKRNV